MKKILNSLLTLSLIAAALVALGSAPANAMSKEESNYNLNCRLRYRAPLLRLIDAIDAFKSQQLTTQGLAGQASLASGEVAATNAFCVAEDPSNADCVAGYRAIYRSVRSKLRVAALLAGNQQGVDMTRWDQFKAALKIGYLDAKCGAQE